jgi:hypothetical protein
MAISVNPSVIALVGTGWKSVGGQMLASGVLLLSGYQDIGLRSRIGAAFGFFMAIAFGISALITAIRANLSYAAAICAVVLCSETFLILRCGGFGDLRVGTWVNAVEPSIVIPAGTPPMAAPRTDPDGR